MTSFLLNIPKNCAIALVHAYRLSFSFFLGGHCRFHPSCSQYAVDALSKHGFFKGSKLTLLRLAKCRPLGSHGYDPVP